MKANRRLIAASVALVIGACTSTVMDTTPQNTTAGGAGGNDQGGASATGGHTGKRIVVCDYFDGLTTWPADKPLPNSEVICPPNQCCGQIGDTFDCCDPTTDACNVNGGDNDPKCELLGAGGSGSTSEPSGSGGSDTTTTTDSSSFGGSST